MRPKKAVPRDAAAIILLREDSNEVFLAQRNPQISFLGGYHAFPGGKVDPEDGEIEVRNCDDIDLARFIVCAVRETFEEIGVLLARGGEKITKGQRVSLHDDLTSGRFSFAEILETWGLWIDAEDFYYAGFWTTPAFSPVRFKTRFFISVCPRRQEPQVFGEFIAGDFNTPTNALRLWENSRILISPPVLIALQNLAKIEKEAESEDGQHDFRFSFSENKQLYAEKLLASSQETSGEIFHIKLNSFVTVFPVRTETLPPATHTNCFIVGERELVVIDPGSPFLEDQNSLNKHLDRLIERESVLQEIIITHLHQDHISGVGALQKHFLEKYDLFVPVAAHRTTAESIKNLVVIDRFIEDEEVIRLELNSGEIFELKALHTPGHARGHLCFYDEQRGFLLSGDNVLGAGSVLIAPPEGNMTDYLNSLERLKNLPNLHFLCGSHGAAAHDAKRKIEGYIAHRVERERKILQAIERGAKTVSDIVAYVYTDVQPELWNLAEKSVEAHLEKIRKDNSKDFIK